MMHKTAGLGLVVALVGLVLDQATKWTILATFADNPFGKITVTPFFDLVLVWNRGIADGLSLHRGARAFRQGAPGIEGVVGRIGRLFVGSGWALVESRGARIHEV